MITKTPLPALFGSALALASAQLNAQILTTTPSLPLSPPAFYASSPLDVPEFPTPLYPFVFLRNLNLYGWTSDGSPNVQASFEISGDFGRHYTVVNATGPLAWSNNAPDTTGTSATELTQLDLSGASGSGPFYLRESPTHTSSGQTTVTEMGGGGYSIDSYFNVWPEISFDGVEWYAAMEPLKITLQVPEPTAPALLALGASGLFFRHFRRRQ